MLTTYFLQQWNDLMLFELQILPIHRQFNGWVWFAYDQAFCEHATATQLADWSAMNVKLFYFHAGPSVRSPRAQDTINSLEPKGSLPPLIPCISWNKGHLQPVLHPVAITIIVAHALEHTQHYSKLVFYSIYIVYSIQYTCMYVYVCALSKPSVSSRAMKNSGHILRL